ncbi:MAG: SDR family NAD(P)-dependent oxidoreductase [Planctomycetaceae bacterium]
MRSSLKPMFQRAADSENMVKQAGRKTFGKLNIMFTNAGIMDSQDGTSQETEEDVWDLTTNVNLKGSSRLYGIPALQRAGGGSIINTGSFVALLGAATPQVVAYTASKGGVVALTRELAVIHARENNSGECALPRPITD